LRAGPERGQLKGIDHDCNDIPDAAMTLAVAALFADGPTAIRNVYNWRVKETERMVAIVTELRKLGAQVLVQDVLDGIAGGGSHWPCGPRKSACTGLVHRMVRW